MVSGVIETTFGPSVENKEGKAVSSVGQIDNRETLDEGLMWVLD